MLFTALVNPYEGPAKSRPMLVCAASPLPPSAEMAPGDVLAHRALPW